MPVRPRQYIAEVLELVNEAYLGAEHPDTLNSMGNAAGAIDGQGQYVEAGAIHRQVLELYTKVLGAEHPYIHSIA